MKINPAGCGEVRLLNMKKRIMLIVPMLDQGGLERVCALTAQLLKTSYDVHLVVFNTEGMIYDVSGVHLIDLQLGAVPGKAGKITRLFQRAWRLSRLQKKYRIEVSYSFGRTANLANALSMGAVYKLAACHSFGEIKNGRYMKLMKRRIDKLLCCSKEMAAEVRQLYDINSAAVWNPCDIEGILCQSRKPLMQHAEFFEENTTAIAAMGRADDVKGYWHLLKIFRCICEKHENVRLVILGAGDFSEYQELAQRMGIASKVLFAGMQKNPFAYLSRCRLYVMTSLSEGLPNALVEALTVGLPIVSTACKSGPAEILSESWEQLTIGEHFAESDYGLLTSPLRKEKNMEFSLQGGKEIHLEQEEQAFADAVLYLLENPNVYDRYKKKSQERAQAFAEEQYQKRIMEYIEGK